MRQVNVEGGHYKATYECLILYDLAPRSEDLL